MSMSHQETILATLPAATDTERVVLFLVTGPDGSLMELRQQSWGEGVGWFTQSSVQLEPQQVAELKQTLGATSGVIRSQSVRRRRAGGFVPRVVRAESA